MFRQLSTLFNFHYSEAMDESRGDPCGHETRLATAALLVEVARSDDDFDRTERSTLLGLLEREYGLSRDECGALLELAGGRVEASISLDEFTRLIDRNFSPDRKRHVMELLWRIACADGRIDKYEEHLIRRIADLIHVPHRIFIQAKLRVQEQPGGGVSR